MIKPLFLDELSEELEAGKYEPKRLLNLLDRIGKIKIFDPACGSGNFLIIAYKELRALEIKILQQLKELQRAVSGFEPKQLELIPKAQLTLASQFQLEMFSRIELSNFYGIELDDFAHEIAILSLWLAQHQMNMKFKEVLGTANPTLPLRAGGNIIIGNATRLNWEEVCPKQGCEVYILGNPPYLGGKGQSALQKQDLELTFKGSKNFKELDYIACWFLIASRYITPDSKFAFVTTSSLCEGSQVEQIWPLIDSMGNEIYFAYAPFNWTNNAKAKAGVTCSIIGLRKVSNGRKYLYGKNVRHEVQNINGYLTTGSNTYITKKLTSLSNLPAMITGNSPYDGGHLLLTPEEKNKLVLNFPNARNYLKKVIGSKEFINGIERWCLWISDEEENKASKIPPIKERLEAVKKFRVSGGEVATGLIDRPHRFRYIHQCKRSQLVIPRVSSSRREYIPFGFLDSSYIISDSAQAIYDSDPYVFAVISSKLHMLWVRLTSGKLRGDIRYLSALSYNTFPFPPISVSQKQELERHVFHVLEEREKHSEKTLSHLYDPEKMPEGLKMAHHELDMAVERCYRSKPFTTDEERLQYLFNLYEQMIAAQKEKGTLFELSQASNPKKKKKAHA
ncbi:MAG: DNA methyltransferase [Bacteroidota bacterium]